MTDKEMKEINAEDPNFKQQRIPQYKEALARGQQVFENFKTTERFNSRKNKKGKPRYPVTEEKIAAGMKRLSKGGFVRGPNS